MRYWGTCPYSPFFSHSVPSSPVVPALTTGTKGGGLFTFKQVLLPDLLRASLGLLKFDVRLITGNLNNLSVARAAQRSYAPLA